VPLTVTVDDGKGLTATDTVTVQVIAPAAKKQITFEDVHFDFDRYSLRPEATRILDEAIKAMQETRTCASRLKATPATSARPNTTWRSASAARRACAITSSSRGINATAADRELR
jgi:hypothetical protein